MVDDSCKIMLESAFTLLILAVEANTNRTLEVSDDDFFVMVCGTDTRYFKLCADFVAKFAYDREDTALSL